MLQSEENQVQYAVKYLKQIGLQIAISNKDEACKAFIVHEVKRKFDEEYAVIIDHLLKDPTWGSKLKTRAMMEGINAFKISQSTYYPQIYIPRFQHSDDLREEGRMLREMDDSVTGPQVYVFYGGTAEVDSADNREVLPGYVLNEKNEFEYYRMVDEQYANENDVWVLSINESLDPYYQLPCTDPECPGGGGTTPADECKGDPECDPEETPMKSVPFPDKGHYKVNCKMTKMIVKDHKESWLAGSSEVCIRARLSCLNDRNEGLPFPTGDIHYRSDQYSNYLGVRIKKVKRKDIDKLKVIDLDFNLQKDWQNQYYRQDPIFFDYVIFERDIFPAKLNEHWFGGRKDIYDLANNQPVAPDWKIKYRSAEKNYEDRHYPYAYGLICNNSQVTPSAEEYYSTGRVNNYDIFFMTTGY